MFKKATRKASKLRIALMGPSGSGKTMTALRIAHTLARGGTVAVVDTEEGSASLYAGEEMSDGVTLDFLSMDLKNHSPQKYIDAIAAAGKAGVDVLVIDSLTHAWSGKGGALEMVDNAAKRSRSGNSYTAWRDITPLQNEMIHAILTAPMHVICTMRVKTEIVMEKDNRGKMAPKKVGLKAIQRDGMEYEFTVVADIDPEHNMIVSKSRCSRVADQIYKADGPEFARELLDWLDGGAPVPTPAEELASAIADAGTSAERVGEWLASKGRPAIADLDSGKLRQLAEYIQAHPKVFGASDDES